MAKSGASKGAKKINAFNDGVLEGVNVAQGKTPKQQNATNMRDLIKDLTKKGKHREAQDVYNEQFPRV